ncbi:MAG TPA: hypothetical protein VKB53_09155 [Gammaproteobacteria bacterium]|nr:hypothetical protein [Gammaproteobacteria bacterium]
MQAQHHGTTDDDRILSSGPHRSPKVARNRTLKVQLTSRERELLPRFATPRYTY